MTNCVKKSVPGALDEVLRRYSRTFEKYETVRFLAFDPAMKNMGITSFILDNNVVDEIIEKSTGSTDGAGGSILQEIVEKGLEMEYAARVNLNVTLTETFVDVLNIVMATNSYLETLVKEILVKPVGTTIILIEKQPEINFATNKIFETVFSFFCHPRYRNVLLPKPEMEVTTLVFPEKTLREVPKKDVTPLGYTALVPLDGYAKNSVTLYGSSSGTGSTTNKYRLNKAGTSATFKAYCKATGFKLDKSQKVDDISDAFCFTVFTLGKLLAIKNFD